MELSSLVQRGNNSTRTGWHRDLKTLRGTLQTWNMFREEVKYMAENLSSCFEIAMRILKEKAKLTVKESAKLKNTARFGLSMAICPCTAYLFDKIYQD